MLSEDVVEELVLSEMGDAGLAARLHAADLREMHGQSREVPLDVSLHVYSSAGWRDCPWHTFGRR